MTDYFKPTPRNIFGFMACLATAFFGQHLFSQGINHHYTFPFAGAPVLTAIGLWLFFAAAWDVRKKRFLKIFRVTKARIVESLIYALIFPIFYLGLMPATLLFFLPAHLFSALKNQHSGLETALVCLTYLAVAFVHFIVLSVFKTRWSKPSQKNERRKATFIFLLCAATFSMTFIGLNPFSL